jgi:thiol-disulfide isomerase/thioredoxin
MNLARALSVILVLALLGGCGGAPPAPPATAVDTAITTVTDTGPPRFGRFVVRPGDRIHLPDFSLKVYGVIHRYDWPEAAFMIWKSFPSPVCTQGAGGVDFIDLRELRTRIRGVEGDYAGLRISVEEVGRDQVTVAIEPYDPQVFTAQAGVTAVHSLAVGDTLRAPGGFLIPREVDHQRGAFRLEFHPDGGQVHGDLCRVGRPINNRDFPQVDLGAAELTPHGVALEVGVRAAAEPFTGTGREPAVGEPAPPITAARWIGGGPVERFERGRIYVVDLWSTWCKPCIASLPKLRELEARHAGQVTFIAVDIWEMEPERAPAFLADHAGEMPGVVALDSVPAGLEANMGLTAVRYLGTSESVRIPRTFIVGQDGRIAWVGSPDDLEGALETVVARARRDRTDARRRRTRDPAPDGR